MSTLTPLPEREKEHRIPEEQRTVTKNINRRRGAVSHTIAAALLSLGIGIYGGYRIFEPQNDQEEAVPVVQTEDVERIVGEQISAVRSEVDEKVQGLTSALEQAQVANDALKEELKSNSEERAELESKLSDLSASSAAELANLSASSAADRQRIEGLLQENEAKRAAELQVTFDDLPEFANIIKPSVVMVQGEVKGWYGKGMVTGSGVIINGRNGAPQYIVTNAHVTEKSHMVLNEEGDPTYKITLYTGDDLKDRVTFQASPVILKNGKRAHSSFKGGNDLALIRLPGDLDPEVMKTLRGANLRDIVKDPIQELDPVIAVGAPYVLEGTFTHGVVSHKQRHLGIQFEPDNIMIQTDAGINPGNSGGPLFSVRKVRGQDGKVKLLSELIGINTWRIPGSTGGAGGAIRIDVLKWLLAEEWGVLPGAMTPEEVAAFEQIRPLIEKAKAESFCVNEIRKTKATASRTDRTYKGIEKDASKIKELSEMRLKWFLSKHRSVTGTITREQSGLTKLDLTKHKELFKEWVSDRLKTLDSYSETLTKGKDAALQRQKEIEEAKQPKPKKKDKKDKKEEDKKEEKEAQKG